MWLPCGVVLMVSGLVGWLYDAHLRVQRTWDRPGWSLRPIPRAGFAIARRVLVVAGWILILLASRWAGVVVAVFLIGAWGWTRWVRSDRNTTRRLELELAELRRREPSSDDALLLARVIQARHPEWTGDLVSQIIRDHPTPAGVARILMRMECGWPSRD